MAGIIFSIIMMMVSLVIWCCTQLLLHFDVTNSILVSGVIQLLTLNKDWSTRNALGNVSWNPGSMLDFAKYQSDHESSIWCIFIICIWSVRLGLGNI